MQVFRIMLSHRSINYDRIKNSFWSETGLKKTCSHMQATCLVSLKVCIAHIFHNSVCSVSSLCALRGFHFFWARRTNRDAAGGSLAFHDTAFPHTNSWAAALLGQDAFSVSYVTRAFCCPREESSRTASESWLRRKRRPFTRLAAAAPMSQRRISFAHSFLLLSVSLNDFFFFKKM